MSMNTILVLPKKKKLSFSFVWKSKPNANMSNTEKLSLIARSNDKLHDTGLHWKVVFPFAIWNFWKSRNDFIFNGKARSPNLALDIEYQAKGFLHCVATPRLENRRVIRYIQWERPEQG